MAAKPLTTEAIALTEKKMDMTLEEIIKMSKNNGARAKKPQRVPNKNQTFSNNFSQDKFRKIQRFMDPRSTFRQGVLAQRRSNFQGKHFPLATNAARKAAVAPLLAPLHNRAFNGSRGANWNKARVGAPPVQRRSWNVVFAQPKVQQQQQENVAPKQKPQTLDSLFANMKVQRMRVFSQQSSSNGSDIARRNGGGQQRAPWRRETT